MRYILLTLTACFVLMGTAFSQTPPSEQPKTISAPNPVFPDEAKNFIYGDSIMVEIDVDKKGKVTGASSLGPLAPCSDLKDKAAFVIKQAAITAAVGTIFEPFLKNGKPVEVTLQITYPLRPRKARSTEHGTKMVQGGVLTGKALSLPKPYYTSMARRSRASGAVKVQVLIGENGKVISAAPVSGHSLLRDESVEAACQARFSPTTLSGEPVKVTGVIMYNFVDSLPVGPGRSF